MQVLRAVLKYVSDLPFTNFVISTADNDVFLTHF